MKTTDYFKIKQDFSHGNYCWDPAEMIVTRIMWQVTRTRRGTHLGQGRSGAGWRGTVWSNRNIIDGYNRRCSNQFCFNLRLMICLRAWDLKKLSETGSFPLSPFHFTLSNISIPGPRGFGVLGCWGDRKSVV
jgi:hypothetical protein